MKGSKTVTPCLENFPSAHRTAEINWMTGCKITVWNIITLSTVRLRLKTKYSQIQLVISGLL